MATGTTYLTEAQWEAVAPVLPKTNDGADPRAALEGMVWAKVTGHPWESMPEEVGDGRAIYRRSLRWGKSGVFERIYAATGGTLDLRGFNIRVCQDCGEPAGRYKVYCPDCAKGRQQVSARARNPNRHCRACGYIPGPEEALSAGGHLCQRCAAKGPVRVTAHEAGPQQANIILPLEGSRYAVAASPCRHCGSKSRIEDDLGLRCLNCGKK